MKKIITTTIAAAVLLSGCGGPKISGLYKGNDDSFLDSLNFNSGGKVELTFQGSTAEGTYTVEDGKVKVTSSGDTNPLTIDGNCLDGGNLIGRYCK